MNFELVDVDGNLIINMELDSNPFKVGEIINIDVWNHTLKTDIDEINVELEILKIEHYFKRAFNYESTLNMFTISIECKILKK